MSSKAMSSNALVRIGRIAAAHGIRGDVKIRCFTETPEHIGAYGPLSDARGRRLVLADIRPANGPFVVARVDQVRDRDAAEALTGVELYLPRHRLPPPEEEEWYYSDLIGLRALDAQGRTLGEVVAVHDFGAGDLIEIAPPSSKPFMVPFTAQCVPDIKIAEGIITVIPLRDADEL